MSYLPLTSFQQSYQMSSSLFMVSFKKAAEACFRIPCWKFGISKSSRKLRTCSATEWTQRKHLGSSLSLCFSSSCVFQVVRIYIFCSELIWYIRRHLTVSFIVPHRTFVYYDLRAEKYSRKYACPESSWDGNRTNPPPYKSASSSHGLPKYGQMMATTKSQI